MVDYNDNSSDPGQRFIQENEAESGSRRFQGDPPKTISSKVIGFERRWTRNAVFNIEESNFISSTPRPTHWSIAWSDLMMTMFILFFSLYTYKAAKMGFLDPEGSEIIGGATTEALQVLEDTGATLPLEDLTRPRPRLDQSSLKRFDPVPVAVPPTILPTPAPPPPEIIRIPGTITVVEEPPPQFATTEQDSALPPFPPNEDLAVEEVKKQETPPNNVFEEIFVIGQNALRGDLGRFAEIEMVPDKTLRIVLTGDLLFELGQSELTLQAEERLYQITDFLKATPYMINVVGHTDNIPMASQRFPSNWELSVARASTVARFLIDKIGMDPGQFVVSGFSSYRPAVPNTNAANRAKNRRVEIIISKRLPAPQRILSTNLN